MATVEMQSKGALGRRGEFKKLVTTDGDGGVLLDTVEKKQTVPMNIRLAAGAVFLVAMFIVGLAVAIATDRRGSIAGKYTPYFTNEVDAAATRAAFLTAVDPVKIGEFMTAFSSVPHLAGSDQNNALAQQAAQNFRDFGFDDVRLHVLPVLLMNLTFRSVTVTSPDTSVCLP